MDTLTDFGLAAVEQPKLTMRARPGYEADPWNPNPNTKPLRLPPFRPAEIWRLFGYRAESCRELRGLAHDCRLGNEKQ